LFFFSSRRRHTRLQGDWSSDVCSSDLGTLLGGGIPERLFKSPAYVGNGSSGGGSTIQPRRTGEDLLLAYIDSNSSNPRGIAIGEIGRASCRERVYVGVVVGTVNKKQ